MAAEGKHVQAREDLAGAFDLIEAADHANVQIARMLPGDLRARVVAAHKGLSRPIVGFTQQSRAWLKRAASGDSKE
ncbi:MAG: hypothetical protein CSA74_00145 [Rhodobacterales bacterium]|nr:MAG: hypothetical protein CSA74_00145 [Rhodobacterales bacterium]